MDIAKSRGFTLIELLVVMAIVGIILGVAMAQYRHAKIKGSETAALTTLRTINRAQFAYMQTCGKQRYAPTLANLGVPPQGTDSAFLSPDLTVSDPLLKSGYVFTMGGTPEADPSVTSCNGATPLVSYFLIADPATPGISGNTFYGTNTDRIIFSDAESFKDRMPETGPPERGIEEK